MKTFFKIFSLVFSILFLWAAYVQYNDPDAYLWYFIYGSAACASLLFFFERLPRIVGLVLFGMYVIAAVLDWPSRFEGVTIGDGDIKNVEEGREALGLLICGVIMLLYVWRAGKGGRS
ncbi:MAG: transmembrane 220 family protein [Sediminicola sp.]|tara:strand:+ start:150453 stop:150806 length:354 start_codon:yes stop_codon:yes gene_type:complete